MVNMLTNDIVGDGIINDNHAHAAVPLESTFYMTLINTHDAWSIRVLVTNVNKYFCGMH